MQPIRRSQRLLEKNKKKESEEDTPVVANINRLQRKNAVILYDHDEDPSVSFEDFVVHGIFKYEIGDKKAIYAKKRLHGFMKLALLFFAIRAAFIFFGVLKPANVNVPSTP